MRRDTFEPARVPSVEEPTEVVAQVVNIDGTQTLIEHDGILALADVPASALLAIQARLEQARSRRAS